MAINKYNIVVKAVLNKTDLYNQIKQMEQGLKSKPISIPVVLGQRAGDKEAIENQVTRWKNKLSSLQALNADIFNSPEIQKQRSALESLFSTYDKSPRATDKINTAMNTLNTTFGNMQKGMQRTIKDGDNLFTSLEKAAYKMALWAVVGDAIFGTVRAIESMIEVVERLNTAMTDIRIVTNMTKEDANALSKEFNQIAQDYGATTQEVAEGATEWFNL